MSTDRYTGIWTDPDFNDDEYGDADYPELQHVFNRLPKKPKPMPSNPPDPDHGVHFAPRTGYVTVPGKTYHARHAIKQLGGYYDGDTKTWSVPAERLAEAMAAVREAAKRDVDLTNEQIAALIKDPQVATGATAVEDVRCWECGESLYRAFYKMGAMTTTLKEGAVLDEVYCGCVERRDAPKRHRPNFREAEPAAPYRNRW